MLQYGVIHHGIGLAQSGTMWTLIRDVYRYYGIEYQELALIGIEVLGWAWKEISHISLMIYT